MNEKPGIPMVLFIYCLISRYGFEFGAPILTYFVFPLPVAIAITIWFVCWQVASIPLARAMQLNSVVKKETVEVA